MAALDVGLFSDNLDHHGFSGAEFFFEVLSSIFLSESLSSKNAT